MHLPTILTLPALALAATTPPFRRATPSCPNINLSTLAQDLALTVNDYWELLPDTGLSATTKVDMHDHLLSALTSLYPDPCILGALNVAIDEFFTSDILDVERRSLSTGSHEDELDIRSLGLDPRFSLKCGRKCKKLLKKVVGTVIEVLTAPIVAKPVCAATGAGAGYFTGTAEVGYLTYYLCMDQVKQQRERNEKRDKFFKLRSSAKKIPGESDGLHMIERPPLQ
ncbi:hypothetical protein B0T16DRAFT_494910 [Cercophora newfieldiana]|uniref:Uncharacterized protein n=1 Tax=Cercophora newfieldiana TaxID=92897 RepID=A0AA39Y0Z1_9PEZI|nr:hypothetical protein B0T16DRAFT_494910 [Cercophora newfieldiana]